MAAGIKNHRAKPVKRSYMYHFQDPEVPVHSDYLKVAYSAEHAALPSDLAGEFIPWGISRSRLGANAHTSLICGTAQVCAAKLPGPARMCDSGIMDHSQVTNLIPLNRC